VSCMVSPFLADHPIRSACPWGTRKRHLVLSLTIRGLILSQRSFLLILATSCSQDIFADTQLPGPSPDSRGIHRLSFMVLCLFVNCRPPLVEDFETGTGSDSIGSGL
jgi:hypothetical protein